MAKFIRGTHLTTAGQGDVWKGYNEETHEPVVLKYLRTDPDDANHEINVERFEREVRAQRQLDHLGIMPILGADFRSERPFYAMPLGIESLADLLSAGEALSDSELVDVMFPVLDAIEFAHAEGIIHRDLKPANIIRLEEDHSGSRWVVADFGLCRDTSSGSLTITSTSVRLGSLAYMAPEQFQDSHRVGPTADIYGLGRVLYHCVTGIEPAFPIHDSSKIPSRFKWVIARATSHERRDRHSSVAELRADMRAVIGSSAGNYTNALDECTEYVLDIKEDEDLAAADALLNELVRNEDDSFLYTDLLPAMADKKVMRTLNRANGSLFKEVVAIFDRHCSSRFPWSFSDRIGDFFEEAFNSSSDMEIRRVCVRRILTTGYDHHRFYVRDKFKKIASRVEGSDAQMVAYLLDENPEACSFISESPGDYSYPRAIRDRLRGPS